MVDWIHQNDLPVCWYALDPLDMDLARFISHLIASITRVFPEFGRQSNSALETYSGPNLDIDGIITAIVNDAFENIKEHYAIVLDDFHIIDSSEKINQFVNRFICEIDENCHVIIASRTLLSLPDLPLMVGRSQVKGISYDELAFRKEEIQALLKQNYEKSISDEVALELESESEGWITGLLLSAQTMWDGMPDRIQVAKASGVGLYDYLAQQVLEQQHPIVREFLLQTSLLEEFDVDLCQKVFGDPPAGLEWFDLIGEVLKNNLFVLPVDDKDTWIRYHHLFRDFLQDWIVRKDWETVQSILNRLARICIQQNNWNRAYEILKRIGDKKGVVELIAKAGRSMLKNRQVSLLEEWFENLDQGQIDRDPRLLSLQGSIDILFGRTGEGISRLNKAEDLFTASGETEELALLLIRRSTGQGFLGEYKNALADAEKAITLVQDDEKNQEIFAEALRLKGLGYYRLGDLGGAVHFLSEALQMFTTLSNPQNVALTHGDVGLVYMDAANLSRALEHLKLAYEYWDREGNISRKVTVLNNIGVLYHREGNYDHASKSLNDTLILARGIENKRIEAYALASIGDLYAELDAFGAAAEAFQLARDISEEINNQRLLLYTLLIQTFILWKSGNVEIAMQTLRDTETRIKESASVYEKGLFDLISGKIALEKSEPVSGIEHLLTAVDLFTSGGQDVELVQSLVALSKAYHMNGDSFYCYQTLRSVITLCQEKGCNHALLVACRDNEEIFLGEAVPADLRPKLRTLADDVRFLKKRIPAYRQMIRKQGMEISIQKSPKITIRALGEGRVWLDGIIVSVPEWRTQPTVRELFFLLLANYDGLTKEEIGLILWPDSSVQQLKVQFKNAVYRLRRALGKDIILFDSVGDTYKFNTTLDYEYDVEMFWDEIARAELSEGEDKVSAYKSAVNLYQGKYLPDGEGYWIEPERERIWRANLKAELSLARLMYWNGDYHGSLAYIHQVLSQDQCQEEAHRLAMKTHAAMGNQADVVRQYEVCKTNLRTLLGISPSRKTETLYNELVLGK
jgi:ATP/maltotriose-dependent transcriptional regulator MalT/two-component SAPR family response regulator